MAESPSELQLEIEKLERKHAENPEGRFFVPLANAYRKLGDLETAEALLHAGIERHPDYLSARIVLGRCLADRGAVQEAEEEFRFVLSQDPQNLIALRTLGELAAAAGRTNEAVEWYNELLAVDPMNEEARQALERLGSPASAEESEEEFHAGGDWWQAGDVEPTGAEVPADAGSEAAEAGADDPLFYGDISLEDATIAPSPVPEGAFDVDEPVAAPSGLESELEPSDEEPDAESYGGTGAGEVVTETIAELYARQGLHDRAIYVYRELIRRRGGDSTLERRLAELERLVGEAGGEEELPELTLRDDEALETPSLDAESDAEEDAFADSVSEGFATALGEESWLESDEEVGVSTAEGASPELLAASASAGGGATIVDFLAGLAAWRPGQGRTATGSATPEATAPEEEFTAGEVATAPPSTADPGETEPAPETSATIDSSSESAPYAGAESEPWGAAAGGDEPQGDDLPYLEQVERPWSSTGTGSADDEPFPWELPEGDTFEQAEPIAESESSTHSEYGLEEAESAPAEDGADHPEPAEPSPAARDERAEAAGDATDDEDLESFQAWLRSLKR